MSKLSIIIPVYNEEKTIAKLLSLVEKADIGDITKEIIVIDDKSTDGTRDILKKYQEKHRVIFKDKNEGKGSGVKKGFMESTGDMLIIQDADLEYDPKDYAKLLDAITNDGVNVVYGSRRLNKENKWHYMSYGLGSLFITFLTNVLYGANITDEATCYKMFRSEVIRDMKLESSGFELCPEITSKVLKKGVKIHEVPISYVPRTIKEGKKIKKWRDGIGALKALLKYRFR